MNVLFLCPHNAAKSVAAAAFFTATASERGLTATVTTGGTDPDADVLPVVRQQLVHEGLAFDATPQQVTGADLDRADVVVNIGCDPARLPTNRPLVDWTIPDFSMDAEVAFAAIRTHVDALVEDLTESGHA